MSENPYPKHIVNHLRYDAWNEGALWALDAVLDMMALGDWHRDNIKALRKEVSP